MRCHSLDTDISRRTRTFREKESRELKILWRHALQASMPFALRSDSTTVLDMLHQTILRD